MAENRAFEVTSVAVATSNVATQLADRKCAVGCQINNPITNSVNVRVGGSTTSTTVGLCLAPGDTQPFPVDNTNKLWVCAESGTPTIQVSVI